MATKKSFHFEKSLDDLQKIVEQMETGDLSLEDALKRFEQGIKLTRDCQTALQNASQKVEILLEDGQTHTFEVNDDNNA